jgi:tetratricopeptide (TPR) repeat protein
VASKAALQVVLTCRPSDDETRENFQALFGDKSRLPLSVRRDYAFRKPTSSPGEERRGAWDRVLAGTGPGRFHDAVRAFQELTQADGQDASAWYNLALARAWLGENAPALEALDRYVALETDPAQAGEAWALAEVLRLGQGLEDQSDHLEYSVFYQIRDPRYLENLLQDWDRGRRLIQVPTAKEERNITVLILDTGPVVTAVPGLAEAAPLGAYVSIFLDMNLLHLWSPLQEGFQRVRAEVEQRAGPGLAEPHSKIRNSSLGEIVTEAVVFPVGIGDVAEANRRVRLRAEQFFEETWVHRPLRSLNGIPPLDAAGHAVLRKKLCGVVQFLQEASVGSAVEIYDFDRLRRKLGLLEEAAATAGTVPADISALGASELAALAVESLSDQQLEQAFQTAQRLDAQELSTRFAQALIGRPPQPDNPDRFPWYAFLVQHALGEGRTDEALGLIGAGEQADQEHNAGRRHSDYELRRGQIHARRGEVEAAQDVFSRLNQRDPENMKNWAAAAEAMLALKQGPHALRFAEEGIAQARKLNDRDSEKYLMELAEAARRVT